MVVLGGTVIEVLDEAFKNTVKVSITKFELKKYFFSFRLFYTVTKGEISKRLLTSMLGFVTPIISKKFSLARKKWES